MTRHDPLTATLLATCLAAAGLLGGCKSSAPSDTPAATPGKEVQTASGLKYVDVVVGTGREAKPGQTAAVEYTGMLLDGTVFDSSKAHGNSFEFLIGAGKVIKGWDEGVVGMKIGGKRNLTVPAALGYGPTGQPPKIPGDATLKFEVELKDLK